jgi:uncharacterized RDD family membrane protein YckC
MLSAMRAAGLPSAAVDGRHYGSRVILPRRIKADLVDGVIGAVIFIGPLLVGQGLVGIVPDAFLRLFLLGIPAGIGYSLLRDSAGGGTSLGKRVLGLCLIRLEDGRPCTPRQVWARNLLDVLPGIDLIDFVWMCVDPHGQKLMDRRLQTQVIERSDLGVVVSSAPPAPPVRPAGAGLDFPSRGRRLLAILAHCALAFIALSLIAAVTVSQPCLLEDRCSSRDDGVLAVVGVSALALVAGIVAAGWSGRLWGARRRRLR